MLGNSWLGNPELDLDRLCHGTGRELAVREQFQNASPNRIAENIECVHKPII